MSEMCKQLIIMDHQPVHVLNSIPVKELSHFSKPQHLGWFVSHDLRGMWGQGVWQGEGEKIAGTTNIYIYIIYIYIIYIYYIYTLYVNIYIYIMG